MRATVTYNGKEFVTEDENVVEMAQGLADAVVALTATGEHWKSEAYRLCDEFKAYQAKVLEMAEKNKALQPEIDRLVSEHKAMCSVVRIGTVKHIVRNADGQIDQIIEMEKK